MERMELAGDRVGWRWRGGVRMGSRQGEGKKGAVKRRSGEEMEREKARDVGEGRSGTGIGAWEWTGERREGGRKRTVEGEIWQGMGARRRKGREGGGRWKIGQGDWVGERRVGRED